MSYNNINGLLLNSCLWSSRALICMLISLESQEKNSNFSGPPTIVFTYFSSRELEGIDMLPVQNASWLWSWLDVYLCPWRKSKKIPMNLGTCGIFISLISVITDVSRIPSRHPEIEIYWYKRQIEKCCEEINAASRERIGTRERLSHILHDWIYLRCRLMTRTIFNCKQSLQSEMNYYLLDERCKFHVINVKIMT